MTRTYNIYTGTAGMERIDAAIKKEIELRNMLDYLDFLVEAKKLAQTEASALEKMLNSKDETDFFIATSTLKIHYNYVANMPPVQGIGDRS